MLLVVDLERKELVGWKKKKKKKKKKTTTQTIYVVVYFSETARQYGYREKELSSHKR